MSEISVLTAETHMEAEKMKSLLETLRAKHESPHLSIFIQTEPRPRNGVASINLKGYIDPLHKAIIESEIGEWVKRQEYLSITN